MKPIYWRSLAMGLLCLSYSAFVPAFAERPPQTIIIEIFHGDLNLATEAGARTALDRIRYATRKACGGRTSYGLIADRMLRECREDFTRRAVNAFRAPMVTELYERGLAPSRRLTRQAGVGQRG